MPYLGNPSQGSTGVNKYKLIVTSSSVFRTPMSESNEDIKLAALMVRIQTGEQAAYREFLNGITPAIMGFIRSRIRNAATAEDIYQTVLLNIHRARHTYIPDKPIRPWLYSITRNAVYDYLRKYQSKLSLETFTGDKFDFAAAPQSSHEEQDILNSALKQLNPSHREAVEMIKLKGLSISQAAEQCGISESAIKVRAHRGYEHLKKILINSIREAS